MRVCRSAISAKIREHIWLQYKVYLMKKQGKLTLLWYNEGKELKERFLQGRIIRALAGFYYVESDGEVYQTRARGHFRKKGQTPFVGDVVDFSAEENSEGYILAIHPRENALIRPAIVNVSQAVVIMSAKEPNFNSNLLDRFLVLLWYRKIRPVIYISKMDLLGADEIEKMTEIAEHYRQIGYQFCLSQEELLPLLKEKVTVFMGQTGVGKSTLLNRIAPHLSLETAEISNSLGRGKHTTRVVALYDVYGGKIADTPGFSSIDYQIKTGEELNQAYPELANSSHRCKFRTCTHTHEPNCAVKLAVESGEIWQERFDNYLQLLSEIQGNRQVFKKEVKKG